MGIGGTAQTGPVRSETVRSEPVRSGNYRPERSAAIGSTEAARHDG